MSGLGRIRSLFLMWLMLAPGGFLRAGETDHSWFELLEETTEPWQRLDEVDGDHIVLRPQRVLRTTDLRILVLFPKQSSAYDIAMAQILDVFTEKRLAAEFELWNFHGQVERGQAIFEHAAERQIDLIFSMGSQTTSYIVDHQVTGSIPVVTVCSKDPVLMGQAAHYERSGRSNIAFTSLDVPVESQIAYLRQLNPNLDRVAVVYASANESAVMTQVEPLRSASAPLGIRVLDVAVRDQDDAREELAGLLPRVLADMEEEGPARLKGIIWITGSTSVFQELDLINRLAGDIPVLSAVPNLVRAGDESAVLSIGVSFENNARIAAIYAYRILIEGARPSRMPVALVSPPDIAINFRKAMEIDLKIPFHFFESASIVYDHRGVLVREKGRTLKSSVLP